MTTLIKPLIISSFLLLASINNSTAAESATDEDLCAMARSNLVQAGPTFAEKYDNIIQFLKREHIPYIDYGWHKVDSNGYEGPSCLDVHGGCGADLFTINPSLEADDREGHPSVYIKPKSAALESGASYYLIGKLEGLIGHKACGNSTEYVSGHVWAASFYQSSLPAKIDQTTHVHTSISKGGHMVAKDYRIGNTISYSVGSGAIIIVSTKDFEGNSAAFSEFSSLYQPLQVYQ